MVKVLINISMMFIFSTPGLIKHLWLLKTFVSLHWCLICAFLLLGLDFWLFLNGLSFWDSVNVSVKTSLQKCHSNQSHRPLLGLDFWRGFCPTSAEFFGDLADGELRISGSNLRTNFLRKPEEGRPENSIENKLERSSQKSFYSGWSRLN